jgi:GntR family transcriptional regulator/MocR family aminotransferase
LHTNSLDTGFATGLLLRIDRSQSRRVRAQLEGALREEMQRGRLGPGAKLPPTRTLAHELQIARSVVVEAYSQLVAEGYLEAVQGAGTRVRAAASTAASDPCPLTGPSLNAVFTTGLPDPAYFPRKEWLRAYRSVLEDCGPEALGLPDPQGRIELRTALSDHLARVRGIKSSSAQLLICNGISQIITIVGRALRTRGATRVGIEDPCFATHRRLITSCGLQPVPIPVDGDGVMVARIREHRVDAMLVAPAHSYPSGAVLSPARRRELVAWATEHDALIIEDDYDAEFRFDRTPLEALQGLAPANVVYAGSASKVLNPCLRIGWVSAPKWFVQDLIGAKFVEDVANETLGQLALARFIEKGALARHIRRVRPRYRARRDRLLEELTTQASELRPQGAAAGLHLFVPLPEGIREADAIATARADGLRVEGAARHWADPKAGSPAVLVGYGMLNESSVERDVRSLVAAIRGRGRAGFDSPPLNGCSAA